MAVSRTLLKAIAYQVVNPGEVLRRLNSLLIPESEEATFVTVFFGVLNTRTGEVQFSNGGHLSPFVVRDRGQVEQLPLTDGMFLGKIPHMDFETKKVRLEKGNTLFLFTDGVSEAMDSEKTMYEESRIAAYLGRVNGSDASELVRGSIADVKGYMGGAPQSDDITVLAVRFRGKQ
jgi:sigma-B regulation protein RsbU (phosphoserine phosphatase)